MDAASSLTKICESSRPPRSPLSVRSSPSMRNKPCCFLPFASRSAEADRIFGFWVLERSEKESKPYYHHWRGTPCEKAVRRDEKAPARPRNNGAAENRRFLTRRVVARGVEPRRLSAQDPKSCVSANFTKRPDSSRRLVYSLRHGLQVPRFLNGAPPSLRR